MKSNYRKGIKGNIGNQNSDKVRELISEKAKERWKDKVWREQELNNRKVTLKNNYNERGKKLKEKWDDDDSKYHSEARSNKISKASKLQWERGNNGFHPNLVLAGNRNKRTWIEKLMANALLKANINYEEQKRIGKFFPDFIINNKIIVECDGEKWHTNIDKDKIRDEYFKSLGYNVIHFKGKEIMNNINECLKVIQTQTNLGNN